MKKVSRRDPAFEAVADLYEIARKNGCALTHINHQMVILAPSAAAAAAVRRDLDAAIEPLARMVAANDRAMSKRFVRDFCGAIYDGLLAAAKRDKR